MSTGDCWVQWVDSVMISHPYQPAGMIVVSRNISTSVRCHFLLVLLSSRHKILYFTKRKMIEKVHKQQRVEVWPFVQCVLQHLSITLIAHPVELLLFFIQMWHLVWSVKTDFVCAAREYMQDISYGWFGISCFQSHRVAHIMIQE